MSASTIASAYTIQGCRNGLPVSKIVKLTGGNCESVSYSDGGTSLLPTVWTEGACISSSNLGGLDFITNSGDSLADAIGHTLVRSVTLLAKTNCSVSINGDTKQLTAGFAYTWSQGDNSMITLSTFIFNINGVEVEAIRENI